MLSLVDIITAIRSLDLGRSLGSSNPETESIKAKTKTTDSQPKRKPQPAKTNPINVLKGPSESQSSKSQPPKLQPERPTVYPQSLKRSLKTRTLGAHRPVPPGSLGPPPKIANREDSGKTHQFQATAEHGAVPESPKKIRKRLRHRTKRLNSALIATQAVPSVAPLLSQPLSSPVPPKSQPTSQFLELTEKAPQRIFKYVVQASGGSETSEGIVGVYSELEKANECAKEYVGRWGVGKSEIVNIQLSSIATQNTLLPWIGATPRSYR
ncbi:hypothetical protein BKA61DRAFT_655050 [Leptodontidium sp. MPI-SDFR-AT-0119]|nr:hypothetical protein BKA61DRAFT_655050 [Leptodontidium sp. MPI-SDFR-AT-0119]